MVGQRSEPGQPGCRIGGHRDTPAVAERLAQGSNARVASQTTIPVAPAERFEVIVDFSLYPVGTRVTMTNRAGQGRAAQVMQFVVARKAADDSRIPNTLSTVEPLPTSASTQRREWKFSKGKVSSKGMQTTGWVVNGKEFDPRRVDANPRLGEVEIWRLATDTYHPPCTSTTRRSRCCPATAALPARATTVGRTPST